ncbi:MAG: hypothetical protein ACE5JP_03150 [Candidatus Bipolaricaulia bacterium]
MRRRLSFAVVGTLLLVLVVAILAAPNTFARGNRDRNRNRCSIERLHRLVNITNLRIQRMIAIARHKAASVEDTRKVRKIVRKLLRKTKRIVRRAERLGRRCGYTFEHYYQAVTLQGPWGSHTVEVDPIRFAGSGRGRRRGPVPVRV